MANFTYVVSFLKAVEEGSFSAAARVLGITPAAVSKHVQSLEASLGVRLIHRSTRSLSLSDAGSLYREKICEAFQMIADAERDVRSYAEDMVGTVKISLPPGIGKNYILPLLSEFHRQNPKIKLELLFDDRSVDLVKDGFDLGISNIVDKDSSVIARPLLPLQRIVVGSPGYLSKRGTPQHPDELAGHNCIQVLNPNSHQAIPWRFVVDGKPIIVSVSSSLNVNEPYAACEAAVLGFGLAMVGTVQAYPFIETGRLIPLLTDYALAPMPIYIYYAHRRQLPKAVRQLVNFLLARAKSATLPLYGNPRVWNEVGLVEEPV